MTKSSFSSRGSSVISEAPSPQTVTPSAIEANLISPDSSRSASSSKSASSKPPSSRVRATKTSYTSPVSKHLANPSSASLKGAKEYSSNKNETFASSIKHSNEIDSKKSPESRTGSIRTATTQSRTLKSSSRTGSSSSINTLTSQGGNDGISDSESGDEQDVRFFDVQSQSMRSSRASSSSKLSSRSKRGSGSATQRKQDGSKKPYKTIDPEEIVSFINTRSLL